MAIDMRKQVLLALALVCAAWLGRDAVSAESECRALYSICSDEWPCCGEMECSRSGILFGSLLGSPPVYHKGTCGFVDREGCTVGSVQFHTTFHEGARYRGDSVRRSTCTLLDECQALGRSDLSSLTWSENVALAVYDEESCGGNSLLVYSAGPYKKVLDDGNTRTQGFLAGGVQDLSKVCKHDRCGYDSYAGAPLGGVLQANNNGSCKCVETWNDCIQSYRIFKRTPQDNIKNVL